MGGEYVLVRSISAIVRARCGQQSVSPLTSDRAYVCLPPAGRRRLALQQSTCLTSPHDTT